jgi:tripartite-type tricarboxylate transporter receptor subunit TctC
MRISQSVAVVALSIILGIAPALAQTYPTRPVRIITGGAGTFHDTVARHLAQRLGERWGQGVIVENQPGAGLTIGSTIAANAPPDGYTLLLADRTSLAAAPSLHKSLRYDPVKDFAPVTLVARAPSLVVVHQSIPAGNLREFIQFAKQQPQPIHFASAGHGTVAHMTGELFKQLSGVDLLPVHYRGGGAAATALLTGEMKFTVLPIPTVLPHVQAGSAKALAVTSPGRFAGAPDIPTGAEAGLPGFEAEQWVGMMVPAKTPSAIVEKLNRDIVDIMRTPSMQQTLQAQGAEVAVGTPAEFAAFIASETARLKKVIDASGMRLD